MITLCGFALSNYYNKVKIVLLEKGVPFSETLVKTQSTDEAVLAASPLGKIPYILVDGQTICESQIICDYLEARFPTPALVPADALAAAKVREMIQFMDLYVELVGRDIYNQAFFGGTASDSTRERVRKGLVKNLAALKKLVRFAPFAAGDTFTVADAAAYAALPTVAQATQAVYGEDLVAAAGIDWKAHLKLMGARPSVQKVNADRKLAVAALKAA
jgi:glutathione S-transferase